MENKGKLILIKKWKSQQSNSLINYQNVSSIVSPSLLFSSPSLFSSCRLPITLHSDHLVILCLSSQAVNSTFSSLNFILAALHLISIWRTRDNLLLIFYSSHATNIST